MKYLSLQICKRSISATTRFKSYPSSFARPPELTPEPPKEVYVSYAWTPASTSIVDRIETFMKARGITLRRDRNELRYKDGIKSFMQRIGRANRIVDTLGDMNAHPGTDFEALLDALTKRLANESQILSN